MEEEVSGRILGGRRIIIVVVGCGMKRMLVVANGTIRKRVLRKEGIVVREILQVLVLEYHQQLPPLPILLHSWSVVEVVLPTTTTLLLPPPPPPNPPKKNNEGVIAAIM